MIGDEVKTLFLGGVGAHDAGELAGGSLQHAGDTLTPILLQYLRWTGDYGRLAGASGDTDRGLEQE